MHPRIPFDAVPSNATFNPHRFRAFTPQKDLDDFSHLLRVSKIGPETYENRVADPKDLTSFGITRQWLVKAKQTWETSYNWRQTEDRINAVPNFGVDVEHDGFVCNVHFVALFSKKPGAVPLLLVHGWPGSFLEFLGSLEELTAKYDEHTLPFHVVVPNLPGYAYSSGPPHDKNFTLTDAAMVCDKLMRGLGFDDGYVSQGGDLGSLVSRILGVTSDACKAVHLDLAVGIKPESAEETKDFSPAYMKALKRYEEFGAMGSAYAREHGTRPATIGLVLSSSPIALLAWFVSFDVLPACEFADWNETGSAKSSCNGQKHRHPCRRCSTAPRCTGSLSRLRVPSTHTDAFLETRRACCTTTRACESARSRCFCTRGVTEYIALIIPNVAFRYIKKPMGYSWRPGELAPVPTPLVAKVSPRRCIGRCTSGTERTIQSGNLIWSRDHDDGGHFAGKCQQSKSLLGR